MAAELHRRGLTGDGAIHNWHCDCPTCEDDDGNGWPFKVQRDSTVDGEVISHVFSTDDWPEALAAMRGLQDAAVEVDAEPGLDAGLHVHVQAPRSRRDRARAFLAFVAWESALTELAQGRFAYLRDMNRYVLNDVVGYLYNMGEITGRNRHSQAADKLDALIDRARTGDDFDGAYALYAEHYRADRHSNLSVNTRFNTWEFRIWNSTRSAWRMEMACRLAVAWADTSFIDCLLNSDRGVRNVDSLLQVIAADWRGDDVLAALVNRQLAYLPRSVETPARFLVA